MRRVVFLSTLFFFLFSHPLLFARELVHQEDFSLYFKGSYKNIYFASHAMATHEPYEADLNRLRMQWDAEFLKYFSTQIIWDHEWIGGNYVATPEFSNRQSIRESAYLNLDYEIVRKEHFFYGQALYRATLKIDPGPFTITLGRQKIDWGSARLLSPADLFTPLTLFDVERDEKPGVDAAHLLIPIGTKSKLNLVSTLNRHFDRSRTAIRVSRILGHFDVSGYGGRFERDYILGIDTSGDIGGAGVRGEVSYHIASGGKDFVQASLGVDYGFANSLYLLGEYFFNGQAQNRKNPFLFLTTSSAQPIKTQYRHLLNFQVKYDFTPLWTGSLVTIADLRGGSVFINPETDYSVLSWMDLGLGALIPTGRSQGEFGGIPRVYYFRTKLSF